MNIDLIIQGPIDGNNVFLSKMSTLCKQFNNVVISTWDHEDSNVWMDQLSKYDNVKIFSQELPPKPLINTGEPYKGILAQSTFYWACLSTLNGLKESEAEYIIKMRSDEYYEDFSIIKKELRKSNNKFICGNIFYKRVHKGSPYHIGDHVYGCKREPILRGLTEAVKYYSKHIKSDMIENAQDIDQCLVPAEIVLANIWMIGMQIPRSEWTRDGDEKFDNFDNNFKVVDINMLGEYVARWAQGAVTFTSRHNLFVQQNFNV
jgi:hypothetical protein